jgi:TATA-box binding protein (TBP) (component of TFIID and TFIIIB)
MDLNADWESFCCVDEEGKKPRRENIERKPDTGPPENLSPKCSSLYISTKTQIAYLNMAIDLRPVFWQIPIIPYHLPAVGIVKKQMKFNSTSQEELDDITRNITNYDYVDQYVINQIINPEGRIKFKDTRKVSIGLSRKDITSYRCKKKSAFYNCFVVIMRLLYNNVYKEIHVKVFNTGKMEIPGIQNENILHQVLTLLTDILRPVVAIPSLADPLQFIASKSETVLINSNFSCNYYIDREKLYRILKYKYKINSAYDPCSYPGIQCEFYYKKSNNRLLCEQTGKQPTALGQNQLVEEGKENDYMKVSFMIFRTGSVLIVGKCTEPILYEIYDFLCKLFIVEYLEIIGKTTELDLPKETGGGGTNGGDIYVKKTRKLRKKTILI